MNEDKIPANYPANYPRNYEGFPEYEEQLAAPCFFTKEPCTRTGCPRWMVVPVEYPGTLVGHTETCHLGQCRDDAIDNAISQLVIWRTMVTKAAMQAQTNALRAKITQAGEGLPSFFRRPQ